MELRLPAMRSATTIIGMGEMVSKGSMMLDGMMAIGLLFMVIGIVDMEKGRERKKEDSLRKKTKRQDMRSGQENEKEREDT